MEMKFFARDIKGGKLPAEGKSFTVKQFFGQTNVKFTCTSNHGSFVMAVLS